MEKQDKEFYDAIDKKDDFIDNTYTIVVINK